jgi:putative peptidoglycan lipid II flippase
VNAREATPITHHEEGQRERARLVARAGVVGAGTLASRILGLVRDMALAALFNREATDAWWVAFTIPNALRSLLGEGAVSSAVVPVLTEKIEREGEDAGRAFFSRVRGASILALALVTVLGVAFAAPLTDLFAAGYHARPAQFERTVRLTRAVFPYIFFMGTAALGMAALHVHRRFAVASFAPGLLNVALLAAAFTLPAIFAANGWDVVLALAAGALLGGVLQVGAQSYFSWAMRLCDFPQGIFAMALSTAALPSLAGLAAKGARDELAKTWAHGMSLALFVAVPASALFVFVGEPIVATLFQRGEFDLQSTRETARALLWQGSAVWTVTAVRQTVPAFYALGDTLLAVALRGPLGHVGVSIAVAGSSAVQMILLLLALKWRMGSLYGVWLARSAIRTAAVSGVASVAGWAAARLATPDVMTANESSVAPGLAGVGAFVAVFLMGAWGMHSPELEEILSAVRRRLGRS